MLLQTSGWNQPWGGTPEPPAPPVVQAWSTLPIGAGGLITGIRIASDGKKHIRTDTEGDYTNDSSSTTWVNRLRSTTMPASKIGFDSLGNLRFGTGVAEIAIAPSNTSRRYKMWAGDMYKSDDGGATWSHLSNFSTVTSDANSPQKAFGPKIAVKPDNADVLYVGTEEDGLWFSSNGGTTFTEVSTADVPLAQSAEGYCIVFSKTNANRVWIGSYSNGWFTSAASATGTGFSAMTGDPTTFRTAKSDQFGNLWVCYPGALNSLTMWNGSSWTNQDFHGGAGANQARAQCVAIDPAGASLGTTRVVCVIDSGEISVSVDGGTTWSGIYFSGDTLSGTGIPWLQYTSPTRYLSAAECDFCPVTGRLYLAAGVGVWWTTDFDSGRQWQQESIGIEQLVVNQIMSRTDGKVIVACWDRAVFRCDRTNYPSDFGTDHSVDISHGWSIDCAPANEDLIVCLNNSFGEENSGYSSDGGQTWSLFPSFPPFTSNGNINGQIAVGSATNFVWVPGNNDVNGNARPHFTTNGGTTWTQWTTPTGVPATGDIGLGNSYALDRKVLCKDWVSGLFYLYIPGETGTPANYRGTYTSPTGQTWTRVNTTVLTEDQYNFKMDAVPGTAGHLFRTVGRRDAGLGGTPVEGPFQVSTNGAVTWSTITNMVEVLAFGFGLGGRLYVFGWKDGTTPGVWYTDNTTSLTPTWTRVGTDEFPNGCVDFINWVTGSKANANDCFVGFQGSGAAQFRG